MVQRSSFGQEPARGQPLCSRPRRCGRPCESGGQDSRQPHPGPQTSAPRSHIPFWALPSLAMGDGFVSCQGRLGGQRACLCRQREHDGLRATVHGSRISGGRRTRYRTRWISCPVQRTTLSSPACSEISDMATASVRSKLHAGAHQ